MVLSVTIRLNILAISPSPLLFSFTSSPNLLLPLLGLPLRDTPIKSVISPIVIGWFFVFGPMVWAVHSATVSALFVHVCCHVDVSVLCVVLMCEEHTCSLVSFV